MSWQALEEALARRRGEGRTPTFWWRDDDAAERSAALEQLLALSRAAGVPVALAVVPLAALPELFHDLGACVLMHGTDHRNRAAPGKKKTEFAAAEPADDALGRLRGARERLAALAGASFTAVLAPPWNRFPRSLVMRLPEAGFIGLSGYGARTSARPAPDLREINTHVDIIDWHGSRGFAGEAAALTAVLAHLALQSSEPTGLLTHHAVHDAAAWRFLERFFERTQRGGARWADAATLFRSSA
jgi:peptidoglycan/xylan/chitin deacetylase (PgdA/CDA1 family)